MPTFFMICNNHTSQLWNQCICGYTISSIHLWLLVFLYTNWSLTHFTAYLFIASPCKCSHKRAPHCSGHNASKKPCKAILLKTPQAKTLCFILSISVKLQYVLDSLWHFSSHNCMYCEEAAFNRAGTIHKLTIRYISRYYPHNTIYITILFIKYTSDKFIRGVILSGNIGRHLPLICHFWDWPVFGITKFSNQVTENTKSFRQTYSLAGLNLAFLTGSPNLPNKSFISIHDFTGLDCNAMGD